MPSSTSVKQAQRPRCGRPVEHGRLRRDRVAVHHEPAVPHHRAPRHQRRAQHATTTGPHDRRRQGRHRLGPSGARTHPAGIRNHRRRPDHRSQPPCHRPTRVGLDAGRRRWVRPCAGYRPVIRPCRAGSSQGCRWEAGRVLREGGQHPVREGSLGPVGVHLGVDLQADDTADRSGGSSPPPGPGRDRSLHPSRARTPSSNEGSSRT